MSLGPWDLEDLPESMKRLPVHLKTGLPIPAINTFGFGDHDFTTIHGDLALALGQRQRCGLCSEKLEGEAAFIGGPQSCDTRAYTDPPMHPACADAATKLCPHIMLASMRRASDKHIRQDALTPDDMVLDKPSEWVMLIVSADDYRIVAGGQGDKQYAMYVPGKEIRRRTFVYVGGILTEVDDETGEVESA